MFDIPEGMIYRNGSSLGPMPMAAPEAMKCFYGRMALRADQGLDHEKLLHAGQHSGRLDRCFPASRSPAWASASGLILQPKWQHNPALSCPKISLFKALPNFATQPLL
ncbi:MAG: hypothetical protein WBA92_14445 [Pseudorhodobacter sp.]